MIKSYVINIDTEFKRREHIVNQFDAHNTEFQFFNAVTPDTASEVIQSLGLLSLNLESLTPGEIACFLSHLKLWHVAVNENLDYIAIFEDDIHLGSDFNKLINDTSWLKDLDIVKLEMFRPTVELSLSSKKIEGLKRKLYILNDKNLGAGGYILSQKGVKYLIDYVKNLKTIDVIDAVLFNQRKYPKDLNVYQLQPAVVIQDDRYSGKSLGLESSLEESRKKKKRHVLANNTLNKKLKKELMRLPRSLSKRKSYFK